MNTKRGARAAGLISEILKIEADTSGKVSGPYLWARIVVDMTKPLRSGILLDKDKSSPPPKWFDVQYENLPFSVFLVVWLVTWRMLAQHFSQGTQRENCPMRIGGFVHQMTGRKRLKALHKHWSSLMATMNVVKVLEKLNIHHMEWGRHQPTTATMQLVGQLRSARCKARSQIIRWSLLQVKNPRKG
jgi:hypothetical protein